MVKAALSLTTFENLVKHLVNIEESKEKLLEEYFPRPSKERDAFKKLFDDYIRQVEQLIRNAHKTEVAGNNLPFVTIGSEVEVEDLDNQEIVNFHLVGPYQSSVESGYVSYLSPVGKSLLLKKVGDEVTVKVPAGVCRYKIKSIRLSDSNK